VRTVASGKRDARSVREARPKAGAQGGTWSGTRAGRRGARQAVSLRRVLTLWRAVILLSNDALYRGNLK
jgi:hypothetical protein